MKFSFTGERILKVTLNIRWTKISVTFFRSIRLGLKILRKNTFLPTRHTQKDLTKRYVPRNYTVLFKDSLILIFTKTRTSDLIIEFLMINVKWKYHITLNAKDP
jgi:hypothetical protein